MNKKECLLDIKTATEVRTPVEIRCPRAATGCRLTQYARKKMTNAIFLDEQ